MRKPLFSHYSLILNYLPLEQGMPVLMSKLEFPFLTGAACQFWLKVPHALVLKSRKCVKFTIATTTLTATTDKFRSERLVYIYIYKKHGNSNEH